MADTIAWCFIMIVFAIIFVCCLAQKNKEAEAQAEAREKYLTERAKRIEEERAVKRKILKTQYPYLTDEEIDILMRSNFRQISEQMAVQQMQTAQIVSAINANTTVNAITNSMRR